MINFNSQIRYMKRSIIITISNKRTIKKIHCNKSYVNMVSFSKYLAVTLIMMWDDKMPM